MALKVSPKSCKRVKARKTLKKYTYLGCPLTKNRSPWCFRMCKPNVDGSGFCGRVAPHGFKSRIQKAIENFNKRQAKLSTLNSQQKPPCNKDD